MVERIAIMQPYLFPYIGYFQLVKSVNRFVFYDDVSFMKQGWIARNRLLIQNKAVTFSVPVKDQSSFKSIRETQVEPSMFPRWRSKFLKTLVMSYGKSPNFKEAFPIVESVLHMPCESIGDLARKSVLKVFEYLDLKLDIVNSSRVYENEELCGQDRVLNICEREGAREYINAPGGRELYQAEAFRRHGIALRFLEPKHVPYKQFGQAFVPALSIIDVLMFNSKTAVHGMLEEYDLS